MAKVLFIKGTPWASGYYRMEQAYNVMKAKGYDIDICMFNTVDPEVLTAQLLNEETMINLVDYDTVVFQLVWHNALNRVINRLNVLGKFTVMEADDNYECLPATNPSFYSFHKRGMLVEDEDGNRAIQMKAQQFKITHTRKGVRYIRDKKQEPVINPAIDNLHNAMRSVKMLQVSTPELKTAYSKYNNNIVVLENCVDNSLYDEIPKVENEVPVIGWFGTKTHIEDLRIIDGCIPENCKLLIAGFPEIIEKGFFKYHKNIEILPPYQLYDLPSIVKRCDIGVVPLVECLFNDGKSDLKGVEFGAGSVPIVASPVAPYLRWVKQDINGFIVKNNRAKDWIKYLNRLIDDKVLRESMGHNAKIYAKQRDINVYIDNWIKVYFDN